MDAGPTVAGGMGSAPLDHADIRAWKANTSTRLSAFEARVLRRLSHEFLGAAREAEDEHCPAPWTPDDKPALNRNAESLRHAMRALTKL